MPSYREVMKQKAEKAKPPVKPRKVIPPELVLEKAERRAAFLAAKELKRLNKGLPPLKLTPFLL